MPNSVVISSKSEQDRIFAIITSLGGRTICHQDLLLGSSPSCWAGLSKRDPQQRQPGQGCSRCSLHPRVSGVGAGCRGALSSACSRGPAYGTLVPAHLGSINFIYLNCSRVFHPMKMAHFISHSPIYGHLNCFQLFLANFTMSMLIRDSLGTMQEVF